MPQFLEYFGSFTSTVHGVLVSSILIPASVTSFFAGSVADKLGRVLAISIGGFIFCLGTALEAAAQNLAMLFVGRCITGVGEGLFLSTLVVYVIEISPARQRGVLASVQQLLVSTGICVGYFVCYGTVRAGDSSLGWRLPFALQSFLAFCYATSVILIMPPSPRWLKTKGRFEEASRAWDRLGVADAEREKEFDEPLEQGHASSHNRSKHGIVQEHGAPGFMAMEPESLALTPMRSNQMHAIPTTGPSKSMQPPTSSSANGEISESSSNSSSNSINNSSSWLRVFHSSVRRRTLLAAFMMGMQQLSGIDGVLYYAPLLFQQAGLSSSTSSFLASGISALLMLLITIPAFLYADAWGRRTSTLAGGLLLATCMFIIGALYASHAVHPTHGAGRWAVVVLIYIFALAFSATWALHIKVYASEIQPLATRAPATSLAQSANWIVNFVVALTTPVFLAHSSFGVYFLFGVASLLTVAVCAVLMPETRGKTLEEISAAFEKKGANGAGAGLGAGGGGGGAVASVRREKVRIGEALGRLSRRIVQGGAGSSSSSGTRAARPSSG
ncbi:hypothetical protein AAFC00_003658 [Neodothiora populina]